MANGCGSKRSLQKMWEKASSRLGSEEEVAERPVTVRERGEHEVAQRRASLLSWGWVAVSGEPGSLGGDWFWVILGEYVLDVRV